MSENFHIWFYIKNFAIFNIKNNKFTLPSELIHYIYSYVIDNQLKTNINRNYLKYNLNKNLQLYDTYRNADDGIVTICRQILCMAKFISPNINDEVTIHMKDLPYSSITTLESIYLFIYTILEYKNYTNITCFQNGKFWSKMYHDQKWNNKSDSIDSLTIKLYST